MSEDIINIILRAENDYHFAMSNATEDAEKYAQESRNEQRDYLDKLQRDFHQFEAEQREHFEKVLYESMRKMNEEHAALKNQLKNCQIKKAEQISKRLKKEVLGSYGDS